MYKITIVIPCYNQGQFLKDSLANLQPDDPFYEVIIINDGSTEELTLEQFTVYKKKGYKIIDQKNAGLAAARNAGIKAAKAAYIMLLDADNIVMIDFLQKASTILDNNESVGVVYSDAEYFEEKTGRWIVGEFNLQKLMITNYIDACAMVRKSVFEELGGYDEEMKKIKSGWEDWDMWLRIAFSGKQFYYLPEVGFKYRVGAVSMITAIKNSYEIKNKLTLYLNDKYPNKLGHHHITNFAISRFKPHPFMFIIKLTLNTWFNKFYKKLVVKNKIIDGI